MRSVSKAEKALDNMFGLNKYSQSKLFNISIALSPSIKPLPSLVGPLSYQTQSKKRRFKRNYFEAIKEDACSMQAKGSVTLIFKICSWHDGENIPQLPQGVKYLPTTPKMSTISRVPIFRTLSLDYPARGSADLIKILK